jgi:hypothetical protein
VIKIRKKKLVKAEKIEKPDNMVFYACNTCERPYFAGMQDCADAAGDPKEPDPNEVVCPSCIKK